MNLYDIEWEKVPASYGFGYGHMYSDEVHLDGLIIISYCVDTDKSSLVLRLDNNEWADSATTQDWPALDVAFGRKHWTQYLNNYRDQARYDLGLDDDDEDESDD